MEFLEAFLQMIRIKDTVSLDGEVIEKAPISSQHRQEFCDILGYTSIFRTKCPEPGCTRDCESRAREYVFRLDVSGHSVNSCLRDHLQKKEDAPAEECDTCFKKNVIYERTQRVVDLKKCVILQLKRFGDKGKINTPVTVDEFLTEGPFKGCVLTGAILHHNETMESGHYTHILRDVEKGTWVHTNDHTKGNLTSVEAKTMLKQKGYIFFYASPDQFPPALKRDHNNFAAAATLDEPTMGSKRREQKSRKPSSVREETSKFRTHDGPPKEQVNLPKMPATSNLMKYQVHTPSEQEIAANIEANQSDTPKQIIDPNDAVAAVLREQFGHLDFRSVEQLAATRELIAGDNDVLVIMSTGDMPFLIHILHLLF